MQLTARQIVTVMILVVPALAGAQAPTWEEAADARYEGIYEAPVQLREGVFEGEPFVAGAASRPRVTLAPDFVRHGDLDADGQDETVVLISENSGGSGVFNYLAVLDRQDGAVRALPTVALGDRVRLMSAEIGDGRLKLRLLQAGAGDPACCPGEVAAQDFAVEDGLLVKTGETALHRLSPADLAGREWRLRQIDGQPPPRGDGVVTLTVAGDEVGGRGGCNQYRGTLTAGAEAGRIEVGRLASTRRACPEPWMSFEQRYLAALGRAVRFDFMLGRLVIGYDDGETVGSLVFD